MIIEPHMNDKAILAEIGLRLARRRLDLDLTQADLAREAGVSKRTVERVEAGESTQFSTIVRILRVLKLLDAMEMLIPASGPRPMDLLKLRGKERQRVSSKQRKKKEAEEWTWGDEG